MTPKQRVLLFAVASLLPGPTAFAKQPAATGERPAQTRRGPAVIVEAAYPGATAQYLADTVGLIELAVHGVDKMLYMTSRCDSDGSYTLTVTFAPGDDLNVAQALVEKRVSVVLPDLSDQIRRSGVTVKKKSPGVLMLVNFSAPAGRYNDIYLSGYAAINLKDELTRVAGVSAVAEFGPRTEKIRIYLDPKRLTARNLTAGDVVEAIKQQNLTVEGGKVKPPGKGSASSSRLKPWAGFGEIDNTCRCRS